MAALPTGARDLQFTTDFGTPSDIRLFEVEEEIVEAVVGGGVFLKGSPNDEVVLTTPTRTYAVRMLETTNVLLLAPAAAWNTPSSVQIPMAARTTLEVVRTAPHLSWLRSLLALRQYRGRASEVLGRGDSTGQLFNFAELVARVQASDGEIRAALNNLAAVQVDGYWRLVDHRAALETLKFILAAVAENEWPLSKLSLAALQSALPHIDKELLVHVLVTHGSLVSASDAVYALTPTAIVASLGVISLAESSNRRQRLMDFMEKWKRDAEDYGVQPTMEMMRGRVVSDGTGAEATVWYWPVEELPVTLKERLAALFTGKARWTAEELRPYVQDFLDPGVQIEAFLARNTRPITSATGGKLYMAREG